MNTESMIVAVVLGLLLPCCGMHGVGTVRVHAADDAEAPAEDRMADGMVADELPDTFPTNVFDRAPYHLSDWMQRIVDGQNAFGLRLYRGMAKGAMMNAAVSPMSMCMNLDMLTNGVKGLAREEILSAFGIDAATVSQKELNVFNRILYKRMVSLDTVTKVAIANSVWISDDMDVRPEFVRACREYYFAGVRERELSAERTRREINSWVSERTEGLIPELLTERLDDNTLFTLVNTIYFRGMWEWPFSKSLTMDHPFHCASGKESVVSMMDGDEDKPFAYESADDLCFRMVGMPFAGGGFEMRFLLPDHGSTLSDCMEQLTPEVMKRLHEGRRLSNYRLYLPRFEVGFKAFYRSLLEAIGIHGIFTTPGDFTMFDNGPGCAVDDVVQEVKVIVSEKMVEASAATAMAVVTSDEFDHEEQQVPIVFDRPFIFMIVDRVTGALIFIGDVKEL